MKPIHNFYNINDYLPILNGALFAELVVLYLVYYTPIFNIKTLKKWYANFKLSAVIADVFILIIGLIIARYIYTYFKWKWNLLSFLSLVILIQIIHDILFYKLFMNIPKGANKMMDLFKLYAKEIGASAILGDSIMITICVLASYYFAGLTANSNIIISVILIYILPYFIDAK